MNKELIITLIIGILAGFLTCFFSQGGIANYKLFLRLTKVRGRWHKYRIIYILLNILLSFYGLYIYGLNLTLIEFMLLISYLMAMTATDLRNRQVPDDATIFYTSLFIIIKIVTFEIQLIINALIAITAGIVLPVIAYFIRKDSIGLGDIKLIACMSIAVGFPGIIYVMAKSFFIGGIYAGIMLIRKKVTKDTELPMVPFILLGAII